MTSRNARMTKPDLFYARTIKVGTGIFRALRSNRPAVRPHGRDSPARALPVRVIYLGNHAVATSHQISAKLRTYTDRPVPERNRKIDVLVRVDAGLLCAAREESR